MKAKKPAFKKISKAAYLKGVKGRLFDEVEPYIHLVKNIYSTSGKKVGFWALARMLFPVIEAVASRIYKERTNKPVKLLSCLKAPCPNLIWEAYRHSLMHGDQPRMPVYRKKEVNWEIRIGGGHEAKRLHLAFDLEKCFYEFISFLEKEISKAKDKSIWIEDKLLFRNKLNKELKAEFKILSQF